MPTENRSSNTEMVSVPEGFMLVERSIWTEQQVEAATACITRLKGVPGMRDCDLAMAAIDAAQCKAPDIALSDLLPAPQPHPDPIAWMVGTAFWRTKEEAERDAAATRLPIVGLGPMADNGEAARLRVELGHMREERDDLSAKLDRFYSRTHGIKNLSAIEQLNDKLAERDALRAALQFYADREHFSEDMRSDWDSVSGEPANVLWHEDEAWFVEDGSIARHALSASAEPSGPAGFQRRVQPWLMECFGEMIAGDREERNHRFLEEALELVQALGATASEAHQLVDYVFGRQVGEPAQEVGGVMVTLAALCLANGLDMHQLAETELARVWTKVEAIRAKQASKPQFGPLPGVYPGREPGAPKCETCSDHGIVGNILNAEPCPDCSYGQPVERDERAEFDAWFRKEKGLHPEADTTFIDAAFTPYRAWKARASLERKP